MDKFDRIFQLHSILSARRTPIPLDELKERLQCSRATIYRVLDALKDNLGAPICFDAERGGYHYGTTHDRRAYELPGLWFNAEELQALVILQRVAGTLSTGLHPIPCVKSLPAWSRPRLASWNPPFDPAGISANYLVSPNPARSDPRWLNA